MTTTVRVGLRRLVEDAIRLEHPDLPGPAIRALAEEAIADAAHAGGLSAESVAHLALSRAQGPIQPSEIDLQLADDDLSWSPATASGRLRVRRPQPAALRDEEADGEAAAARPDGRARGTDRAADARRGAARPAEGRRGAGPASLGAAVGIALALTLGVGQRQAQAPSGSPASSAPLADGGPVPVTGPLGGERGGRGGRAVVHHARHHRAVTPGRAASRPARAKAPEPAPAPIRVAAAGTPAVAKAPVAQTPAPAPVATSAPKPKPKPRPSSSETWASDFTP